MVAFSKATSQNTIACLKIKATYFAFEFAMRFECGSFLSLNQGLISLSCKVNAGKNLTLGGFVFALCLFLGRRGSYMRGIFKDCGSNLLKALFISSELMPNRLVKFRACG